MKHWQAVTEWQREKGSRSSQKKWRRPNYWLAPKGITCRHAYMTGRKLNSLVAASNQWEWHRHLLRSTIPCHCQRDGRLNSMSPLSTSSMRRHLRSAAHGDLVELRYRTTRYGKRSFPASAQLIWNSLLTTVRDVSISVESVHSFSGRLKAELFRRAYGTVSAYVTVICQQSART